MIGPCAKAQVRCTIISPDGRPFVGTNYCLNAQPACPREPGEGYEKCASICRQVGHAEQVAYDKAAAEGGVRGGIAYLEGHTYACQACQERLFGGGLYALRVVNQKPPRSPQDECRPV